MNSSDNIPEQVPGVVPEQVPEQILEEYAVDELMPAQKQAVLKQLHMAPDGKNRLSEIEKSNSDILQQYPSHLITAQICDRSGLIDQPPSSFLPYFKLALMGAVATIVIAGVFLFAALREAPIDRSTVNPKNNPGTYYGVKGEPQLIVHRKTGDATIKMSPNDTAKKGDLLQIMYNAGGLGYGVIFSYDGAGALTLHYPTSPTASNAMEKGGFQSVAHSYELDDAPQFETFVFVGANKPLHTADIIETVREQLNASSMVSFEGNNVQTVTFTVNKTSDNTDER